MLNKSERVKVKAKVTTKNKREWVITIGKKKKIYINDKKSKKRKKIL